MHKFRIHFTKGGIAFDCTTHEKPLDHAILFALCEHITLAAGKEATKIKQIEMIMGSGKIPVHIPDWAKHFT